MHDIHHIFVIKAPQEKVFEAVSEPSQMAKWWSRASSGISDPGEVYRMNFGPEYHWKAEVSIFDPANEFEITFTEADQEWTGTKVGFKLNTEKNKTLVEFWHKGWPDKSEHYKISAYCWAMYLRLLKRFVESGEVVPYKDRLEA